MISICIPTLNTKDFFKACIESIKETVDADYEINVLDLGDDGSHELAAAEGANIWRRELPCYFGESCDFLISKSAGDLILLVNSDVVLKKNCVDHMLDVIIDEDAAIVGARLMYPPDSEIYENKLSQARVQHAGVIMKGIPPEPGSKFYHRGYRERRMSIYEKNYTVPAVTGACMLLNKQSYYMLGGFDKRFMNCYEDIDLCLRAWASGMRVVYCGQAMALHWEARTMGTDGKTPTSLQFQTEGYALLLEKLKGYGDVLLKLREEMPDIRTGQ